MVCSNNNKCICPEGINCEACNSNPCANGSTCRAKGSTYECICAEGWNGTDCEIDIDECKTANTCQNGICVNKLGGFKCYCEPGFTGLRCDVDVDECLSKPCQNGATCVNQVCSVISFYGKSFVIFKRCIYFWNMAMSERLSKKWVKVSLI